MTDELTERVRKIKARVQERAERDERDARRMQDVQEKTNG